MDHRECLINGLMAALKSGRHSDITIEVEERSFECHKVILEAVSPYFKYKFLVRLPHIPQRSLRIKDITVKGFEGALSYIYEGALSYIYSGSPSLNKADILDVLQASFVLQIERLHADCEEMLINTVLSFDTCINLWQIAETCDCTDLLASAKRMALDSFDEVVKETNVSEFKAHQLVELFNNAGLEVSSEVAVLSVALQWAQHSSQADDQSCRKVFAAVHLDLISDEEWKSALETDCTMLHVDLLLCLQSLWEQSKMKSQLEKTESIRICDRKEKILVFFDEFGTIGCYALSNTLPNVHESPLEVLHLPPIASGFEDICCLKSCVHKEELYVEAFLDGTSMFKKMCAKTGQWVECTARSNDDMFASSALVSCNNSIFAVNGFVRKSSLSEGNVVSTSAKIQRYTLEEDSWKTVCTLPDAIKDPVVGSTSCFICIYNRSDHPSASVFTYNYKSDILKQMGTLPSYVPKPDLVVSKGRNLFLFSNREVTRLKNILDEPYTFDMFDEVGKYTRYKLKFHGVLESGKTIYCLSGDDEDYYVLWEFNSDKLCLRKPRVIHSIRQWKTGGVLEMKRRFLINKEQ